MRSSAPAVSGSKSDANLLLYWWDFLLGDDDWLRLDRRRRGSIRFGEYCLLFAAIKILYDPHEPTCPGTVRVAADDVYLIRIIWEFLFEAGSYR